MSQTAAFIYAHPDDETFLSGCLIRQMADQGDNPILLLATRGEAGNKNGHVQHLSKEELAIVREKEMGKAAAILGLSLVEQLGFPDGKLNMVKQEEALEGVIAFINKHRPQSLFTFPEDGGNGHPDHIAISKLTTQAFLSGRCPSVQKLYYFVPSNLQALGNKPAIVIDTESGWSIKAEALRAHESQIFAIERYFGDLQIFPEQHRYEAFVLGHSFCDKSEGVTSME